MRCFRNINELIDFEDQRCVDVEQRDKMKIASKNIFKSIGYWGKIWALSSL